MQFNTRTAEAIVLHNVSAKGEPLFKKIAWAGALAFALLVFVGFHATAAAEDPVAKTPEIDHPVHAYRLDFFVNEMEDGKKINSRQYSMNLNADDSNDLKIGTRVPVEIKPGEFQYIDVGTNISCRLQERADGLPLSVRAEVSNFTAPDQQNPPARPLLRQLTIRSSTLASLGKPMVVGSVDDPNSRRQFQLEVTVNKTR